MYLRKQFEKLSDAKIKEGIFDGPQIRKMFKDQNFIHHMNEIEKSAWLSLKVLSKTFYEIIKVTTMKNLSIVCSITLPTLRLFDEC